MVSSNKKAYLAGFLDGDGSIYVRLKPNASYKYGYQIAPYIVLFQSEKARELFETLCNGIGLGYMRARKDGVLEYTIGRVDSLKIFVGWVRPYLVLKKEQANLLLTILDKKERVANAKDFEKLMKLVDRFRELNYSKKRKIYRLTP